MKDASTLEIHDKEIQCRFSIGRNTGSARESLQRPMSPVKQMVMEAAITVDYGVQVCTESVPIGLQKDEEEPMMEEEEVKSGEDQQM